MSCVLSRHNIFQKSFINLPRNVSRNVYTIFLVILRKIFRQGFRNICWKTSRPSYEDFKKLCLKHSARFGLIKELAWNMSINVSEKFKKYFAKYSWPPCNTVTKYFRKVSETFRVMTVWIFAQQFHVIFREIFLQGCGNIGWKVCNRDLNNSRTFHERFLQDFV